MLSVVAQWVSFAVALSASIMALYKIWKEKKWSSSVAATFAVLMMLISNLPSLELIKGFGVEARTVSQKADQALDAYEKIKAITKTLAIISYNSTIDSLFVGYVSFDFGFQQIHNIEQLLKATEVKDQQVQEAKDRFQDFVSQRIYAAYAELRLAYLQSEIEADKSILSQLNESGVRDPNTNYATLEETIKHGEENASIGERKRTVLKNAREKLLTDTARTFKETRLTANLSDLLSNDPTKRASVYRHLFDESINADRLK